MVTSWMRWVVQTATRWEDLLELAPTTGVASVDEEHQRILEYVVEINKFFVERELNHIRTKEEIAFQFNVLDAFARHMKHHFDSEMELMRAYDLPNAKEHHQEHSYFLRQAGLFITLYKQGKFTQANALHTEITIEVIPHIHERDVQDFDMANFFSWMTIHDDWSGITTLMHRLRILFLDEDHFQITFKLIEWAKAVQGGASAKVSNKILSKITDLIETHFGMEQRFLMQYGIDYTERKIVNDRFLGYIHSLQIGQDMDGDNEHGASDMVILQRWTSHILVKWLHHVNQEDKKDFGTHKLVHAMMSSSGVTAEELAWLIRSTGSGELDLEHHNILRQIMEIGNDSGTSTVSHEAVEQLVAEMNNHFDQEYRIMREMGISEGVITQHADEHRQLLRMIYSYTKLLDDSYMVVSPHFRIRIADWLITHINGVDYETFVMQQSAGEVLNA